MIAQPSMMTGGTMVQAKRAPTGMQPLGQERTAAEQQMDAGPLGALGAGQRLQASFGGAGAQPLGGMSGAAAQPAMQSFGAQNNLIGQQINPTNSAQTGMAAGLTNNAAQQYANQSFTPFSMNTQRAGVAGANQQMQGLSYDFSGANQQYGNAQQALAGAQGQAKGMLQGLTGASFGGGSTQANTGRFNADLDGALKGLEGPNRGQIAAETLALLEERSAPGFEQSLRNVNAKNAAMGRRGSGITTNELGDVTLARERELGLARRDVANEAASRTLSDRLDIANQQRGVANDRFGAETFNANLADRGLDRNTQAAQFGATFQRGLANDIYGMGRDSADMAMTVGDRFGQQSRDRTGLGERQATFGRNSAMDDAELAGVERRDEFDRANFGRQRFNDFAGFQRDREQQDRSNRNEMRDERQYQYGLSQDSIDQDYRRMNFEEGMRNNRFARGMDTTNFGFGANSPAGAYANAGAIAGQQSADGYGAAGMLLGQMGANRRRGGAGSGSAPSTASGR